MYYMLSIQQVGKKCLVLKEKAHVFDVGRRKQWGGNGEKTEKGKSRKEGLRIGKGTRGNVI